MKKVRNATDRSYSKTAVRVARILGPDACVLIGGLAVAAHGHQRATKDIDFITRLPLREARKRLAAHGLKVELREGDPFEDAPAILRLEVDRIPVDILPMLVRFDWEHLPEVPLAEDAHVKVIDLDTLLLLKTRAGGLQDMLDVAHLIWRHPDRLPCARECADRYGVGDKLQRCLEDGRERQRFVESLPRAQRQRALDALDRLSPVPSPSSGRRRLE